MSSPPPTKPPRGVKQGKETSGLLMSVIRTLSASETNEQREKERAKLEKEYKKSDAKLDELVAEHASEIMEVMQKFNECTSAMSAWGQHCEAASSRLAACQSLLQVRHDDLQRLWQLARTHHYALAMLTDIEHVVVSDKQAREAMSAGRVLAAATTLQAALTTIGTTLAHVTALNNTKEHLEDKKRELVDMIVKELCNAVYKGDPEPMARKPSGRRRTALLLAELTKCDEVTDHNLQELTPEYEASLQDEDKTFETTVRISLEALGILDQLKEGAEKFKVQIQTELLQLIDAKSRRIVEEGDALNEGEERDLENDIQTAISVTETDKPLAKLFWSLNEEFKICGERNKRLIQVWRVTFQRFKVPDSCLHTEQHYWSAVQQVLQLLLTEYLDIESVAMSRREPETARLPNIAEHFAKKRVNRPPLRRTRARRVPQNAVSSPRARFVRVCSAAPERLHAVMPAIHAVTAHIENQIGGGECSLRAFITDYVVSGEAERLSQQARAEIDSAARQGIASRERTSITSDSGAASRVLSGWCLLSWRAVSAAVGRAARCGACGGGDAARAVLSALAVLAAHCRHAHHRLVPHTARATRWLADDDIVRFLQSLPNWKVATSNEPVTEDRQHEQELKEAYSREAEILGSSLGDGAVTRKEIVSDMNTLSDVALMCESMNWLSVNIKSLPQKLSGSIKLTEKLNNDIMAAATIFEEIEHKCLLFLHLEIRIQCFHYLGEQEASDETSEASGAAKLSHALLALHELAQPIMATRRLNYIFSGVGEMMSAGIIWRCTSLSLAASRLAALRHCLAALRLPHVGLHAAHHYLHLLGCEPQEIITSIKEKGPKFSELEYLNAFKIIAAKRGLSSSDMKMYLNQLSDALGNIGVTV